MCSYFKGTKAKAAKNLLWSVERSRSLRLIAEGQKACDFDEFMKGLRWLASQDEPCKGCRFGGGWSWWPDCPVRDCTIQKGFDFCYQWSDFPCRKLKEGPLVEFKRTIVAANNQLKTVGIEDHLEALRAEYQRAADALVLKKKTLT